MGREDITEALHRWGRAHRGALLILLLVILGAEVITGTSILLSVKEIRAVPCYTPPELGGYCVPLPSWPAEGPGWVSHPYYINESGAIVPLEDPPRIYWSRWFPWVVDP